MAISNRNSKDTIDMSDPDPQLTFDDIQRFVSRDAFETTKDFVQWYSSHGRPLEVWLALVAALAIKRVSIDETFYPLLKTELDNLRTNPPKDGVGLKQAAQQLAERLKS